MSHILTYEEIERICRAAAELGIRKIKVTGGEPFVRLGCTDLMRNLKAVSGIDEVTVTTNGQVLERYIDELKEIGIDGINISLDTLDPGRYRSITGRGELERTLRAIDLAAESGIRTKINCLLQKGLNEDEIFSISELAFAKGIDVRFIELMPDDSIHGNGPAVYYRRPGVNGSIGLISAIHGIFCSSCNRIRLTSQGKIRPCLCYDTETDVRPFLSRPDDELREAIREAILSKPEAHCFNEENKAAAGSAERRLMSQIGG